MRLRLRTDRLAELLGASRLSQNHWALRLGLSKGHWSDLVNGRHPFPSPKTRERMLEVFGVTQDELFVVDESRADDLEFRVAIAPRYEIMQELGQGAMGTVFLATDRTLGRLVAVKVVSPEATAGVGSGALLKEIAFVARLQHPNILPLFEAGEHARHPYYVMPWVRDGSLRALLNREGRLSLERALPLVHGIARGLSYAHERQILHCDVKPENVLVQDGHAFVMDFGIARKLRSEVLEWDGLRTELDFSAGTPAYVSPEQARGDRTVDQRSDVYSLACMVFEMLSGHAPFGGRTTEEVVSKRFHEAPPSLRALVPEIPSHIGVALERAMSIDPAFRPESARDLADELARPAASARAPQAATARLALESRAIAGEHILPTKTRSPSRRQRISMTGFRNDLRYAFRGLRRGWRFALGVILTLGLGVGLGVPVLSLADHFFLRPPPGVADADRVVRLVERGHGSNGPYFTDGLTGLDYATMTSRAQTLDGVAGWMNIGLSLGRGRDARSISAVLASASYFSVLGVRPFAGRFYQESEDVERVTAAPCVVSYRFWQRDLNGARDAIGRKMLIGTVRYTVVGVAPDGFNGLGLGAVDVWLPLHVAAPEFQGHDPQLWNTDHSSWLRMVAHIKPGIPLATATAEAEHLYRTAGARTRDRDLKGPFLWDPLQPGRSSLPNVSAKIALWLSAGGGLLLLLVAANLANLFVARSAAHTRQTAVRLAIGGSWRHLLRLQLSEALILGACSAALGLVVAIPAVKVTRTLLLPGVTWVRPLFDARIAGIAFGVAFGVGAIVALWSTAHALRVDPADLLRGSGTTQMSGTRRSHAIRRLLLVVQAAIFAVLVTSASAFVVSLRRASNVDFGFDLRDLMAASIPMSADTPMETARATILRAYERISAMPQVESASLAYMEPWSNNTDLTISVPGSSVKPPWTLFDVATPDYLKTFGVRMRSGRWIDATDNAGAPVVIVINESLERVFWPSGGAIGQCIRIGADSMPCRTIVGVVRDFHVTGSVDDPPRPIYYLPVAQTVSFSQRPHLFFRARGDATAAARSVRLALQGLESNLPAIDVHPVSRNVEWLVSSLRLGASAFTAFGILATIVGAVGLYSVLSFLIIEQRRMHAIKLALGATSKRVAMSVVSFAAGTALFGMALGYVALLPIAKVLKPMLFRTTVLEPMTVAWVVALGSVIALVAAFLPVRSVLKTDVMAVLREQ